MNSELSARKSINEQTRIAIVHDWIFERRGGEKVLERILNLFPQAHLYYLFGNPESVLKINHKPKLFPSFLNKVPFISKIYKYLLPFLPVAIENFDLKNYDLVISTSSCVAKGIIPHPNSKHISYIHSPMRYAWDQEQNYFKTKISYLNPLEIFRRILLSRLRIWDVTSSVRCDKMIANSQFVARRCELFYGKKSDVIYPPVNTDFFLETIKKRQEGAPHRASLKPPKNQDTIEDQVSQPEIESPTIIKKVLLFGAWVPYKKMYEALELLVKNDIPVIAAGRGFDLQKAHVHFKGKAEFYFSPSDEDLLKIFSQSHTLLFPAIEDFGIVPVEAMSCGLWVVAPNEGGTKETVLNKVTGFTFKEGDNEDMLNAVKKALEKETTFEDYDDLKNHAEKFSPESFDLNILSAVSQCYLN